MKKLLFLLATVGIIFTACEAGGDVEEENGGAPSTPKIELSQQSIEVEFEPAKYEVAVTSPYSWEAKAKNDWIEIETRTGIAGMKTLKFSVTRNEGVEIREGTIVVKNDDYNLIAELYVTQGAFVPAITIEPETLTFAVEGGTQEVAITANFEEYEFSTNVDWLTVEKSENGLKVTASNYTEVENRTAEITISNEKYGISKTISLVQKGVSAESKNVMLYTSSNGKIVTPYKSDVFGANIVSNTYRDGQGLIIFDAPITSIGDYAFSDCASLTSITIPDGVNLIGEWAFSDCISLASVTIGNSVTSIGTGAFCGCISLTNITIPNSVTSIEDSAFSRCTSLTSVTIGNGITSIGSYAFAGCTSLTRVTIGNGVTSIGGAAFYGCTSLKAFYGKYASSDNRCLIVDGVLNSFAPAGLTEYTIPNSVTKIGDHAFSDCRSLTSVTIPDSVTSIEDWAFEGCTSLTTFYGEFASSDNRCLIINGELNSFAPAGLSEYTIPDSVTSIGGRAFCDCTSLTSITIPDSVTLIGSSAFSGCTSLTSVYCKPTTPPTGDGSMFSNNASGRKIYVPIGSGKAYKAKSYWSNYADYIEEKEF